MYIIVEAEREEMDKPENSSISHTTCVIPEDVVEKFKKYKAKKNLPNWAMILNINRNELIVEVCVDI